MAERHQQTKTSFLFVQLRAPLRACAPPPAPARTAAAGARRGPPFPRSRGRLLGGRGPRAPLPGGPPRRGRAVGPRRQLPCCSAPAQGGENPGPGCAEGALADPRSQALPAPASSARGRRQPGHADPLARLPAWPTAAAASAGWTPWPDGPGRPGPQARDASGCSPSAGPGCRRRSEPGVPGRSRGVGPRPRAPAEHSGAARAPARASRARLCRHRAPQAQQGLRRPPAALPLKVRKCVRRRP